MRALLRRLALFLLAAAVAGGALAQAIEPLPFRDHAQELRYQRLTGQLRCPMCQNETLADSNAPIAHDLRGQIFALMQKGQSDDQIKQYLVARYGDYVLYQPPVKPYTWLLWFGPGLILAAGAATVAATVRKRTRAGVPAVPADNEDDW